jgi:hypothetical protein
VPARTPAAPARAPCHVAPATSASEPYSRAFPRHRAPSPHCTHRKMPRNPPSRHAFAARPHGMLPTGPPRVPARAPLEALPYQAGTSSRSSRQPIKPSHARLLARVRPSTSPCSATGHHLRTPPRPLFRSSSAPCKQPDEGPIRRTREGGVNGSR